MIVFFDTLQYVKNLSDAGIKREHAEALAKEQTQILRNQSDQLATKADLKLLEEKIEAKLDSKFESLDARFENLEERFDKKLMNLQLRIGGMIFASFTGVMGVGLAILKFMF